MIARVAVAVATAGATALAAKALRGARCDVEGWRRRNFRDREVTLDGGVATVVGALTGAALLPRADRGPALVLVASAAAAGAYDDLVAVKQESTGDKGWRGHLAAVRAGRISGGAVKVVVIGTASLVVARSRNRRWVDVVPAAVATAATANLLNLFDLRPGRAGKVAVVAGLVGSFGPAGGVGAVASAAAGAELTDDLAERTMLGDVGANALGVLLGWRLARSSPVVRAIGTAAVLGLTAASERISFSAVIAKTDWLRRLDEWGRSAVTERP